MNEGRIERHLKGFRDFITYGKSTEFDRKGFIDESQMLEMMEENYYQERNNSLLKMTRVIFFVLHFKFVVITEEHFTCNINYLFQTLFSSIMRS